MRDQPLGVNEAIWESRSTVGGSSRCSSLISDYVTKKEDKNVTRVMNDFDFNILLGQN